MGKLDVDRPHNRPLCVQGAVKVCQAAAVPARSWSVALEGVARRLVDLTFNHVCPFAFSVTQGCMLGHGMHSDEVFNTAAHTLSKLLGRDYYAIVDSGASSTYVNDETELVRCRPGRGHVGVAKWTARTEASLIRSWTRRRLTAFAVPLWA